VLSARVKTSSRASATVCQFSYASVTGASKINLAEYGSIYDCSLLRGYGVWRFRSIFDISERTKRWYNILLYLYHTACSGDRKPRTYTQHRSPSSATVLTIRSFSVAAICHKSWGSRPETTSLPRLSHRQSSFFLLSRGLPGGLGRARSPAAKHFDAIMQ